MKGKENVLKGVDEFSDFVMCGLSGRILFRDSHNSPLAKRLRMSNTQLEFPENPHIHSGHHNNKLYKFLDSRKT